MRYSQNMRDSDFSVLVGIKNCCPVIFDPFWSFSSFLSGPVVSKTATETLWNSSEVLLSVTDGSVTRVYITCSHMKREIQFDHWSSLKKTIKSQGTDGLLTYDTHRHLIFNINLCWPPPKGSKIMSKPRVLPDKPGIYSTWPRQQDPRSRREKSKCP